MKEHTYTEERDPDFTLCNWRKKPGAGGYAAPDDVCIRLKGHKGEHDWKPTQAPKTLIGEDEEREFFR